MIVRQSLGLFSSHMTLFNLFIPVIVTN